MRESTSQQAHSRLDHADQDLFAHQEMGFTTDGFAILTVEVTSLIEFRDLRTRSRGIPGDYIKHSSFLLEDDQVYGVMFLKEVLPGFECVRHAQLYNNAFGVGHHLKAHGTDRAVPKRKCSESWQVGAQRDIFGWPTFTRNPTWP